MNAIYLVAIVLIGAASVVQPGINREIAKSWGLAPALLLNNIIICLLGIGFLVLVHYFPDRFPEIFRGRMGNPRNLKLWYFVPALCGFAIVTAIPWVMDQMGAAKVFLMLIAVQIVASLLWDYFVEAIPFTAFRVLGAGLAVLGAWVTTLRR